MKPTSHIIILIFASLASMTSAHAQSPHEDPGQVVEQALEWKGQYGGWIVKKWGQVHFSAGNLGGLELIRRKCEPDRSQ